MRTRRALPAAVLALLAAIALVVSGCSSSNDDADTATRVVTTDLGDVQVPVAPKRVVVLNFALAGYLYDLDVPVVGVTPEQTDGDKVFSPDWAAAAERNGTQFLPWSADGFDHEAILNLEPDLIVAGGLGFPLKHATDAYAELSRIAPTVVVSGELTEWRTQYEFLADKVFAKPEKFREAVAAYDRRIEEVKGRITVPPGESVFLSVLADGRAFVLIEGRGVPKEFERLGFRPAPLFASGRFKPYTAGGDSFELSTEQVGQVVTQDSAFVMGFNGDTASVAKLRAQPIWAALPAFTANRAYDLPYWVQRSDFHEAMKMLDIVEEKFAK